MLVLSRKKGQRITIGPEITLTLCAIRGDKARIGIDAPAELKIHREGMAIEPSKRQSELEAANMRTADAEAEVERLNAEI